MKAAARLLVVLALVAPAYALAQAPQVQVPVPTCRLYASATVVNYNTRVRLDWISRNATGGYLTEVGAIAPNSSAYVVPGKNTTYAASFIGPGGIIVCRVAIAVHMGVVQANGALYSGGVVNIDGTTYLKATSIATSLPINTSGGINTSGSGINTAGGVNTTGSGINTSGGIGTGPGVNTSGSGINTSGGINTAGSGINTSGSGVNTGSGINTSGGVNTTGSGVNTSGGIGTGPGVNTSGGVNTESWINTNGGINTAGGVNISGSSINTSGGINTIGGINTTGSGINTNGGINTDGGVNTNNSGINTGSGINTSGGVNTTGSGVNTSGGIGTGPGVNTSGGVNTNGPGINTSGGISTVGGVNTAGSGINTTGSGINTSGSGVNTGSGINTSGGVNTTGSGVPTGSGINTSGGVNTSGSGVNTSGSSINTNNPINTTGSSINTTGSSINTNAPVNLNGTVNLGGNVTIPTVPSIAPGLTAPSGSGLLGGIVPAECRGANTVANCDLCSLAQMGQNLANFGIGLTIPAAVLLFAWVGILYFSARGKESQITQAHKVFRSVVIGLVIAVAAFTLVNTIMKMLIHGTDFNGWNWSTLNCTQTRAARLYNMNLSQYLSSSLNSVSSYAAPATGGSAFQCVSGTLQNGVCVDSGGNTIGKPVEVVTPNNGGAGISLGCSQYGSGYALAGTQCYGDDAVAIGPALRPGQLTDAQQDQLQDECEDQKIQASCNKLDAALGGASASANYSTEDRILLDACSKGDMASCRNFSASSGSGELGARVSAAMDAYKGTDTSAGPDGGNKACAWAVNSILQSAGIAPVGDGVSVESMESALKNGRGTAVSTPNAVSGDIIVWKEGSVSHVGICQNAGCTTAISNSSSDTSFTLKSGSTLSGVPGRVYHLNN